MARLLDSTITITKDGILLFWEVKKHIYHQKEANLILRLEIACWYIYTLAALPLASRSLADLGIGKGFAHHNIYVYYIFMTFILILQKIF